MNNNQFSEAKTIVRLGSLQEKDSQIRIPAFYVIRAAKSPREAPTETLLVSLNLPIEQVNSEPEIFNRFVSLWIEYAQESGYEFEYDQELFEKTGEGWRVIES